MKTVFLGAWIIAAAMPAYSQDSTETQNHFTVSGYVESYYVQDFHKTENHTLPGFIYNHNRTNEVNLNLAMLRGNYNTDRLRANISLAAGTYMNANYAAEPGVLKNIYEANAGIKIAKNHNLWLDAGIMPSHIGFESAIGKDNWALTRSLVAENTPYFESGAKLGYTSSNDKWYVSAMYLNGWQRIQRFDGNSTPAFGTQITFKPTSAVTLNYSTFIGSDKPDSLRQMRYYHNIYGIFQVSEKWGITAGFDIGSEQKQKGSSSYNTWYVPVLIARFSVSPKVNIAARGEYYHDQKGVIITSGTENGFQTYGFSMNCDYAISSRVMWRIEARNLTSKDAIFNGASDKLSRNKTYLTTAITFTLN
ncbi:MAG: porin [Dyadobacter sp.]|uniref:porin n=1 Tax=Dyadobacter sp. TaxID=1914288 RepID=UPI00326710D2